MADQTQPCSSLEAQGLAEDGERRLPAHTEADHRIGANVFLSVLAFDFNRRPDRS
ncbi:MAG: hypothetical protein ACRBN8_34175 [Nannocystales bacterium]